MCVFVCDTLKNKNLGFQELLQDAELLSESEAAAELVLVFLSVASIRVVVRFVNVMFQTVITTVEHYSLSSVF